MEKPLLSICIPTYNRDKFLSQCLENIAYQLKDPQLKQSTEIVISDNGSNDNTRKVVNYFQNKLRIIRYYRNKINLGVINTTKVGSYARGKYIWFLSDDDLLNKRAISEVLNIINNKTPDLITCNSSTFKDNIKNIISENNLKLDCDICINSKKDLFKLLEKKFLHSIDWYMLSYSMYIVKRSIFLKNLSIVKKNSDHSSMAIPHAVLIYYSPKDYKQYILSKITVFYRADNISWSIKNQYIFSLKLYELYSKYYLDLIQINKGQLSMLFIILIKVKLLIKKLWTIYFWIFSLVSNIKLVVKKLLQAKRRKK